jgi:hypothetical protein
VSKIASIISSLKFYIFCFLNLRDVKFKFIGKKIVYTGWSEAVCYFKVELPIQNIYAYIKTDNNNNITMPISETPHYQYISSTSGKEIYFKYKKEKFGLEKKYVENKFDNLISSISENGLNSEILISKDMILPTQKCAYILDGVHRSSVLLSQNKSNVECYIAHKNQILN